MHELAQRFMAFETIVKLQTEFSESDNKLVRLVNFTSPDGKQSKKFLKTDGKVAEIANVILSSIKKVYSKEELEELLVLLGDELLK